MTTKFNKDMYAKMRSKKDEPLSNIGKKTVCVTGKGPSVNPDTSVTPVVFSVETARKASPSTSIEELPTPASKRPRMSDMRRKWSILARPLSGITRDWRWTRLTGS